MEQYKTCTKCGQTKSLDNFSPSKGALYGVRSKCKPCCAEQTRNYRMRHPDYASSYGKEYRAKNPDKVKENNRKFRESNPDYAKNYHQKYRDLENLRGRQAYWANPAKQSLRKKLDRQKNPERYKERNKRYAANNQDKLNEKSQRRRAYKLNAKRFALTKKEIWRLYNSKCFYCESPSETMDHVMPLSRGGDHGIGNLVPCCGSCNYSKAGRTVMEWRIWKLRMAKLSD